MSVTITIRELEFQDRWAGSIAAGESLESIRRADYVLKLMEENPERLQATAVNGVTFMRVLPPVDRWKEEDVVLSEPTEGFPSELMTTQLMLLLG